MDRRRLLVHGTALLPLSVAGCLDAAESLGDERSSGRTRTTAEGTAPSTATSVQTVSLVDRPEFPAGPKDRPSPPTVWDESSARAFAVTYEERRLYNQHHREETEEITIGCHASEVDAVERGYEVSLWCQGAVYEESATTHGDYIGPEVLYRLTPRAVTREVADS